MARRMVTPSPEPREPQAPTVPNRPKLFEGVDPRRVSMSHPADWSIDDRRRHERDIRAELARGRWADYKPHNPRPWDEPLDDEADR